MNIQKDLETACNAALAAGEIIKNGFGNIATIDEKIGKGFVTDIDKKSEASIIEILKKGSNYTILGEETGKSQGNDEASWIVDPLDGTTNFMRKTPLFAISIALVKNTEVLVGVVYNPITNDFFSAGKGLGTYKNDKKVIVSQTAQLEGSIMMPEHGYGEKNGAIYADVIKTLAPTCYIRAFGSTALELAYVAAGHADAFMSVGDELWDYAAGILLVQEAGGKVTDWKGKAWDNSNSFILASNGVVHDQIVSQIKDFQ